VLPILRLLAATALVSLATAAHPGAQEPAAPASLYAELNPPAVPGAGLRAVEATSATLEWPAALSSGAPFRVEVRRFSAGGADGLTMRWEAFPSATITRHGERYEARLKGLLPAQPHWFRVRPVGPGEALFAVRFQTPARAAVVTARGLGLGALVLTLAALLWLRWRGAK